MGLASRSPHLLACIHPPTLWCRDTLPAWFRCPPPPPLPSAGGRQFGPAHSSFPLLASSSSSSRHRHHHRAVIWLGTRWVRASCASCFGSPPRIRDHVRCIRHSEGGVCFFFFFLFSPRPCFLRFLLLVVGASCPARFPLVTTGYTRLLALGCDRVNTTAREFGVDASARSVGKCVGLGCEDGLGGVGGVAMPSVSTFPIEPTMSSRTRRQHVSWSQLGVLWRSSSNKSRATVYVLCPVPSSPPLSCMRRCGGWQWEGGPYARACTCGCVCGPPAPPSRTPNGRVNHEEEPPTVYVPSLPHGAVPLHA